ncbi:MAG: hypothetical protein WBL85_02960 [Sedimentisphaerales bacterium]
MVNRKYKPGLPRKGWHRVDEWDLREDGSSPDETNYATCEACNHYPVRYVHVLQHDKYPDKIKVGRDCAGNLTEDYKKLQVRQTNREAEKLKRLLRRWKTSRLKVERFLLTVFPDKNKQGFWKWGFVNRYTGYTRISNRSYPTIDETKLECLNELFAKWLSNIV